MASRDHAPNTGAATPKSAAPERLLAATRDAMDHLTVWQGQGVYEAATLDAFHEAVTPALVEGLWRAAAEPSAAGGLTTAVARAQADMWQEERARARSAESAVRQMLAALIGVVRVADRSTTEFDAARAAIAMAFGREAASPAIGPTGAPDEPNPPQPRKT